MEPWQIILLLVSPSLLWLLRCLLLWRRESQRLRELARLKRGRWENE